jgi:hypothetical protein
LVIRKKQKSSSRYKGVTWSSRNSRWKAQIPHGKKRLHLGYFVNEEEAARAYDAKARELRGDAAVTNADLLREVDDGQE